MLVSPLPLSLCMALSPSVCLSVSLCHSLPFNSTIITWRLHVLLFHIVYKFNLSRLSIIVS